MIVEFIEYIQHEIDDVSRGWQWKCMNRLVIEQLALVCGAPFGLEVNQVIELYDTTFLVDIVDECVNQ